jgi:hypothetical protein
MRSSLPLLAFLLTPSAAALAQQDFSATITETLEVPDSAPDVSTPAPARPRVATVWYAGCDEVRLAGRAPLYASQPGYRIEMDGDNDGVACEYRPEAMQEARARQRRSRR